MSPELADAIARQIAEDASAPWPRSFASERGVLFLHGSDAFFWFLAQDGRVLVADHDTFAMKMEVETDSAAARAAIEAAASRFPALTELLVQGEIEAALVDAIRSLVRDLAEGHFVEIEADGRGGRLTADELATAVREYGRTLQPLPPDVDGLIDVYPHVADVETCSLDVDLWTAEEGRSDLTLQLVAKKIGDGYHLEISDLHVL